jgi:hypothetical protein
VKEPTPADAAVLQEVDDAVRRDEMTEWWKRWGTWVLGAAVLAVVAVAGNVGWKRFDQSQRAEAGAAYTAAVNKAAANDVAGAKADFEKQAQGAREPYRSLARLMLAELADTNEKQAEALAAIGPTLGSTELADLALVMAAFRSVDAGKADEMIAKLEPLAGDKRPFRISVRELQAISAVKKGDVKKARELWTEIVKDPEAPQGAQQRATAMINLNGGPDAPK